MATSPPVDGHDPAPAASRGEAPPTPAQARSRAADPVALAGVFRRVEGRPGPPVQSRSRAADPSVGAGVFRWPVDGPPRLVRRFDPPPQPWLAGHRGVDLAAVPGAPVRAAGPGTVLFAGMVAGRPVVTVGHADGMRTTYEPVQPSVTGGASVSAGAPLGALLPAHPGCPDTACLHWGLRRGEEYLDPLTLLGLGRVRLFPVAGPVPPARLRAAGGRGPLAVS
ncbi:murein hydrolase activator EnvC family protein [Micromonospora costi]|uniref:murein hydrolase activator EnvC family protein n=1 Tax=Micromonospora costi TaxID=1530042 RepID=UPI001F4F0F4A|nr:M23 family metallopeptidase [Micromonospora costi]